MVQSEQKIIIHINILEGKMVITDRPGSHSIITYDLDKTLKEIENHNNAFNKQPHQTYQYETPNIPTSWDWSKLTDKEIDKLRMYYRQENWSMIMDIHNTKKLTDEYYCCSSYIPKIKLAFNEMGF